MLRLSTFSRLSSPLFSFVLVVRPFIIFFFFFNDTATTEIYTLSLHDALPISSALTYGVASAPASPVPTLRPRVESLGRSEEHTSELQSLAYLVCRLLLEKKKKKNKLCMGNTSRTRMTQ